MTPDLTRVLSRYYYVRPSIPFTAHDAIAIALLRGRHGQSAFVETYLETAWRSLVVSLELTHADEAAGLLCAEARFVQSPMFERFEPMVFGSVLATRRALLDVINVHSGLLEGDPWGGQMVRESLRPSLELARGWYDAMKPELLKGLIPIDRAICAMLSWDSDRSVDFSTLRDQHGWREPTEDEVFEHWID